MSSIAHDDQKDDQKKKAKSGSQKRQRTQTVRVACTAKEYAAITERAASAGLSRAAYLRASALGDTGPRARPAPHVNRALLADGIASLNRVGNNLNQIAHYMNAGRHPDRSKVAGALEDVGACLQLILDALGRAE